MNAAQSSSDQDWRLRVELATAESQGGGGRLGRLFGRVHQPDVRAQAEGRVPPEVVLTHDGALLFAYASSQETLAAARAVIEEVLGEDGLTADVRTSHWREDRDRWEQVDPPLTEAEQAAEGAADQIADQVETRTLVLDAGNYVRETLESSMREAAEQLGLQCEIVEHPHLLKTQVAFTLTGPRGQIDRFAAALRAEGRQTVRAEMGLMSSGL